MDSNGMKVMMVVLLADLLIGVTGMIFIAEDGFFRGMFFPSALILPATAFYYRRRLVSKH